MSAGLAHRVQLQPLPGLRAPITLCTHDPARDLVSRKIHEQRIWEPFETRLWLAGHDKPGRVVVDVGANLGHFSLLSALHENRPGAVFAFEPAADNFALLQANLAENKVADAVVPVQAALGEQDGTALLYRSADNLGDHQLSADDAPREQEKITLLCGADYLARRIERIDLLKIDTQGSEHAVLQGLLPLLRRSLPALRVLVELTPFSLLAAGSSGRELIGLLASLDLPLAIVDHIEHRLVPSDAQALSQWCDNVEATVGDRGFMNIFAGEPPAGL